MPKVNLESPLKADHTAKNGSAATIGKPEMLEDDQGNHRYSRSRRPMGNRRISRQRVPVRVDRAILLEIAMGAIRRSLSVGPVGYDRTERDWQAVVLEQLDSSTELASAGLSAFCELRAHWRQPEKTGSNARVDIALIDDSRKVPALVIEIKAAVGMPNMKVKAREDLAKLCKLDFDVFDDEPIDPEKMAVAFPTRSADVAVIYRRDGDREIVEEVTPLPGRSTPVGGARGTQQGTEPMGLVGRIAAELIRAPSAVLFRDRRYKTVTYQSNEATWQMRVGSRCVSGRDGWSARYEVGLHPGRADLLISAASGNSSRAIAEFKVHGELLPMGNKRSISSEDGDAYVNSLVSQGHERTEPRRVDGRPILTGLHHWEKKIRECRGEYRRCAELIRCRHITNALLLFEDYAMIRHDMHDRLGLPDFEATQGRSCIDLKQAYPQFNDALMRLSERYKLRSEFFARAVSEGLKEKGIEIHYFGTLRLPWPATGETILLHSSAR